MSDFKRNPKAEEEFPFLKTIGDLIDAMNALKTPSTGSTAQKKALDKVVPSKAETAGLRHLSRMVH